MQPGRRLNCDRGPITAHPRLHEGDQPWGTVYISADHPCPVDNEVSESSTTAEFIVLDVCNSEAAGWAKVHQFYSKSLADLV